MRKESRVVIQARVQRVSAYHHGSHQNITAFVSDRFQRFDSFDELNETGRVKKLLGIELETEFDSSLNESIKCEVLQKIVFSYFPKDLFKVESDCSLRNGAECISQTMTKAFIRNNYRNFKLMYDTYFPSFGISCAYTGNCGMHVNLSLGNFGKTKEQQDLAIKKMHYFVNKYFSLCCGLFARDERRTSYCGRMAYENARDLDINALSFEDDHHVAINYGHYRSGRMELRLVGGQKNFATFRNTMETIFFLLDRFRNCSWSALDNFEELFKGCNQYVLSRLQLMVENGKISTNTYNTIAGTSIVEDLI